jgi:hypothetical protein
VSDGEDSASIVEEIRVGTRLAVETLDGSYPVVNSPYILALPAAASGTTIRVTGALTLQEGVEILFDVPGGTLSLEGGAVFSSQGTADNPIVIRPNDRTLRCQNGRGWWVGVLATGTSRIVFDHTAISYGERNINLRESSSAVLTNSDFKCSSEASVEIASGGSLVMDNCEVTNNASVGVGVRSQTSITPDSVVITNSNISINGNMGIRMELRDAAMASDIRVEMNRLEFNFTHGVYLTNQVFPKIHNNHFESNGLSGGLSNLRLQPPYPAGVPFDTLDATSNYWGGSFTNQADVDATIHDSLDDAGIGTRIKTNPWLNQSPLP